MLEETYYQIRDILLADQPFVGPILKNLGHWLGLQTLAKDKSVSEERLPLKEVILSAAHGDPLYLSCWAIVPIAGSFIHLVILGLHVDILFLLGQLHVAMHPLALTFISVWR